MTNKIGGELGMAIDAIKRGMGVIEAAQMYHVDVWEIAHAINPNGGDKPVDSFQKEIKFNMVYKKNDGTKVSVAKVATIKKITGRSIEIYVDKAGQRYLIYRSANGTSITESSFKKTEAEDRKKHEESLDNRTRTEKVVDWIGSNLSLPGEIFATLVYGSNLVTRHRVVEQYTSFGPRASVASNEYLLAHPELLDGIDIYNYY